MEIPISHIETSRVFSNSKNYYFWEGQKICWFEILKDLANVTLMY